MLAHKMSESPVGMLAYPRFDDRAAAYAEAHNPWATSSGHEVSFRRLPVAENACVQAFREMLRRH